MTRGNGKRKGIVYKRRKTAGRKEKSVGVNTPEDAAVQSDQSLVGFQQCHITVDWLDHDYSGHSRSIDFHFKFVLHSNFLLFYSSAIGRAPRDHLRPTGYLPNKKKKPKLD